jgi:hypothetical protein
MVSCRVQHKLKRCLAFGYLRTLSYPTCVTLQSADAMRLIPVSRRIIGLSYAAPMALCSRTKYTLTSDVHNLPSSTRCRPCLTPRTQILTDVRRKIKVAIDTDWGVCSWPWNWFAQEKADPCLFVTSNRCSPFKIHRADVQSCFVLMR